MTKLNNNHRPLTNSRPLRLLLLTDNHLDQCGLGMIINANSALALTQNESCSDAVIESCAGRYVDIVLICLNRHLAATCAYLRPAIDKRVKIVALADRWRPRLAEAVLSSGADGLLTKQDHVHQLSVACQTVMKNEAFICPELEDQVILNGEVASLSQRDEQIITLLASGYTSREIGDILHLSKRTVEGYRRAINQKLGLTHRHQLVSYALAYGLIG